MSLDRRTFLSLLGAGASASFLQACDSPGPESAVRLLRFAERQNEGLERSIFRHTSRDRVPSSAELAGNDFPKYHISEKIPVWDPAVRGVWRLEVSGAVRKPLSLSLEDLVKLRQTAQRVNHYCVEGWTARAEWTGVRVSEIVKLVEPLPDAHYVDFQSFDADYHESWDLESALHPQTIIAYAKDGRYLSPGYGAPARLHSPIKLGYKSTKYLTKVVFMPQRNGGYWSDQGYEWYAGT
jgi:DMSO/TMAO reductase YedYZ molybdopterin-dependent catalytic subunit